MTAAFLVSPQKNIQPNPDDDQSKYPKLDVISGQD
jgi:hypothetical protein